MLRRTFLLGAAGAVAAASGATALAKLPPPTQAADLQTPATWRTDDVFSYCVGDHVRVGNDIYLCVAAGASKYGTQNWRRDFVPLALRQRI